MAAPYRLYQVKVGSSNYFTGLSARGFTPNEQVGAIMSDGSVDPTVVNVLRGEPSFAVTSTDLAAVLGVCGFSGTDDVAVVLYEMEMDGAAPKSGTGHTLTTLTKAFVYPTSINLPGGAVASASFEGRAWKSDGTIPYAVTTGALPSITAQTASYGLGPVSINGTAYSNVSDVTITTGISIVAEFSEGLVYPKRVFVLARQPRVVITLTRPPAIAVPTALSSTGLVVYARKRTKTSFVADGTAEHVKLTFEEGVVTPGGQSGNPVSYQLIVTPIKGSNASMQINTASAIS
jgi:hypothetical protein